MKLNSLPGAFLSLNLLAFLSCFLYLYILLICVHEMDVHYISISDHESYKSATNTIRVSTFTFEGRKSFEERMLIERKLRMFMNRFPMASETISSFAYSIDPTITYQGTKNEKIVILEHQDYTVSFIIQLCILFFVDTAYIWSLSRHFYRDYKGPLSSFLASLLFVVLSVFIIFCWGVLRSFLSLNCPTITRNKMAVDSILFGFMGTLLLNARIFTRPSFLVSWSDYRNKLICYKSEFAFGVLYMILMFLAFIFMPLG